MFTAEQLESEWKVMRDFEREHFGLKFGRDFSTVAEILRSNKNFMTTGVVSAMLAALEMSGLGKEIKESGNQEQSAKDFMDKPNGIHNALAEMFYLGYSLGKKNAEVNALEHLAAK